MTTRRTRRRLLSICTFLLVLGWLLLLWGKRSLSIGASWPIPKDWALPPHVEESFGLLPWITITTSGSALAAPDWKSVELHLNNIVWLSMITAILLIAAWFWWKYAWCALQRSRLLNRCDECGYQLVGVQKSPRCPECGTTVVGSAADHARRIDWVTNFMILMLICMGFGGLSVICLTLGSYIGAGGNALLTHARGISRVLGLAGIVVQALIFAVALVHLMYHVVHLFYRSYYDKVASRIQCNPAQSQLGYEKPLEDCLKEDVCDTSG